MDAKMGDIILPPAAAENIDGETENAGGKDETSDSAEVMDVEISGEIEVPTSG